MAPPGLRAKYTISPLDQSQTQLIYQILSEARIDKGYHYFRVRINENLKDLTLNPAESGFDYEYGKLNNNEEISIYKIYMLIRDILEQNNIIYQTDYLIDTKLSQRYVFNLSRENKLPYQVINKYLRLETENLISKKLINNTFCYIFDSWKDEKELRDDLRNLGLYTGDYTLTPEPRYYDQKKIIVRLATEKLDFLDSVIEKLTEPDLGYQIIANYDVKINKAIIGQLSSRILFDFNDDLEIIQAIKNYLKLEVGLTDSDIEINTEADLSIFGVNNFSTLDNTVYGNMFFKMGVMMAIDLLNLPIQYHSNIGINKIWWIIYYKADDSDIETLPKKDGILLYLIPNRGYLEIWNNEILSGFLSALKWSQISTQDWQKYIIPYEAVNYKKLASDLKITL